MDTWIWVLIAAGAIVVVAALAYWVWSSRRTTQLKDEFGPEYQRTLEATGSRREAEKELVDRQKRVEQLHLQPLSREQAQHYAVAWNETQAAFVDAPTEAIGRADGLVAEVMEVRGYPMAQFDQRVADISVEHPKLVTNYRSAHMTAVRNRKGEATTEELRRAMVQYRELFDDLLDTAVEARSSGGRERSESR
ncbi:MAG: hypothetical protein HYX53_15945 [Chloroflexi bacterium]|nr:hypothetical protein [Chloroflexota bacterium]